MTKRWRKKCSISLFYVLRGGHIDTIDYNVLQFMVARDIWITKQYYCVGYVGCVMEEKKFISRSIARLLAVQALYQLDMDDASCDEIIQQFLEYEITAKNIENLGGFPQDFFVNLVRGVALNRTEIDSALEEELNERWKIERLESIIRVIIEAGLYEIMHCPEVDLPIIFNEYIEITRAFFDGKEGRFVNGVLDRLGKKIRAF